jgi:lysophospholipase L1-like esterase
MTALRLLLAALTFAAVLVVPAPEAQALPLLHGPRILQLGDSITWQSCSGAGQFFASDASLWLRERDGGCHGWSGATTADMAFQVQGGRFWSNGDGQPHPYFPNRGMADVWNVREAMDRADVIVFGLGTNDANRRTGCATIGPYTPWPVQIDNAPGSGPNPPPCQLTDQQFREHIDYFVWLANGKPVFWVDVAVTNPADPAYAHQDAINREIWAAAGRHANFHPIPWNRAVTANPGYVGDGVHLSPSGGVARWRMVEDAIRGCGYR